MHINVLSSGARNCHLGQLLHMVWKAEVSSGVQEQSPGRGRFVPQKLKQFADIVDRF